MLYRSATIIVFHAGNEEEEHEKAYSSREEDEEQSLALRMSRRLTRALSLSTAE